MIVIVLEALLFTTLLRECSACNGYTLKLNSVKKCIPESVIQTKDFDVDLDKDCNFIPKGCLTVIKPFKSFAVHYSLSKPPLPNLTGDSDICKYVQNNKSAGGILSIFGFPMKCPVSAQKACVNSDKKVNIGRFKSQLGYFSGNLKIKVEGKHDTGNSCMEFDMTLNKERAALH